MSIVSRCRYVVLMPPYVYDDRGRRVPAPSKGELRERAILNEAERQLRELGPDGITVESIANAAGINRATLYFYFRSKNDVLAALIERVVDEMVSGVATSDRTVGSSPAVAISEAIRRTALLWQAHGPLLRAAVDLSPSVEAIARLWSRARDKTAESATSIVIERLRSDSQLKEQLPSVIRALVVMTEREFYTASAEANEIDRVVPTIDLIWQRTLGLSPV